MCGKSTCGAALIGHISGHKHQASGRLGVDGHSNVVMLQPEGSDVECRYIGGRLMAAAVSAGSAEVGSISLCVPRECIGSWSVLSTLILLAAPRPPRWLTQWRWSVFLFFSVALHLSSCSSKFHVKLGGPSLDGCRQTVRVKHVRL